MSMGRTHQARKTSLRTEQPGERDTETWSRNNSARKISERTSQ